MNLNGRTELFTSEDCVPESSLAGHYEGKFLVVSPYHVEDSFDSKYQNPESQIFYATGGFGCSPATMGTAVFGQFISDGERCRMERRHFSGILKPELVKSLGLEVPKDE